MTSIELQNTTDELEGFNEFLKINNVTKPLLITAYRNFDKIKTNEKNKNISIVVDLTPYIRNIFDDLNDKISISVIDSQNNNIENEINEYLNKELFQHTFNSVVDDNLKITDYITCEEYTINNISLLKKAIKDAFIKYYKEQQKKFRNMVDKLINTTSNTNK